MPAGSAFARLRRSARRCATEARAALFHGRAAARLPVALHAGLQDRAGEGGARVRRAAALRELALPPGHRSARHAARQPRDEHHDHFRSGAAGARARLFQPRLSFPRLRARLQDAHRPDRQALRRPGGVEDGHRRARAHLPRDAPGGAARRSGCESTRGSRRPEAAHAGRTGLAPARPVDRRYADAHGHARGVSRAADRGHRRPGKPADDLQRGEVPRGLQADGAHLAPRAAGVVRDREALLRQAFRRPAQEAPGRGGAGCALERRAAPRATRKP